MRILIHSNASFVASGYGKQTRLFAPRLAAAGHEVAISAFFGLQGARLATGDGLRVYPRGLDTYGNDVLELHAKDFFGSERDGLVVPLTDIWVMQAEVLARLNTAAWVPVDHEPCQPPTVDTLRRGGCVPIAMSRFGERMLAAEGLDPVYVPHGVETELFTPLDQAECRRQLEIPQGAFLVGMVAANQGQRKSFPQAIRAFARFQQRHPDALLYLHTWLGDQHQGVDLHDLIAQEIRDPNTVMVCDQYRYAMGTYSDDYLARAYNAMDVLLNPAQGEGFGCALIEAQACGVPLIVTNATSMPELCGSGILVGGTEVYTSFKSWQLLPSIDELQAALEASYGLSALERLAARRRAREFALGYDADTVTSDYWAPALDEIAERIKPRKKSGKRPRAKVPA